MSVPGPLRYSFTVDCGPDDAFRLWTRSVGFWWPMATHSISGEREATLAIEPHEGGRIFERSTDGREFDWGRVALWEPPHRLVCDWLVGDVTTELEVRFLAQGDQRTLVEIEHRGWERFGDEEVTRRDDNDRGWSAVLTRYVAACGGSPADGGPLPA